MAIEDIVEVNLQFCNKKKTHIKLPNWIHWNTQSWDVGTHDAIGSITRFLVE